jgi:hypothetical protein
MTPSLVQWNTVVTATHFNPSIFSQLWLVRNRIVLEAEFAPGQGTILTDDLVQVMATDFTLLVLRDQMQIAPKLQPAQCGKLVQERIGAVVTALPHTPYRAAGTNFVWHIDPGLSPLRPITRRYFSGNCQVYKAFNEENAHFGAYLSKDVTGGARLKLDIKPVALRLPDNTPAERLQLAFNFNHDLDPEKATEQIQDLLSRWDFFLRIAQELTNEVVADANRS